MEMGHSTNRILHAFSGLMMLFVIAACGIADSGRVLAEDTLVTSQQAFKDGVKKLRPGDQLILKDGIWADFEMVIEAYGSAEKPIIIKAQTPGGVILTGQSSLKIGGQHLVVHGLVFRDGYSAGKEVISLRRDSKTLANHVRLTEIVVDRFNKPNRTDQDSWIVIYGQNNRIDHTHLVGKTNKGPTMVVRLNSEDSQNNGHLIDHNYFGPRPPLGGNGGETLRIGTSAYSRTRSGTVVKQNIFDRCSGEVEIISVKSEYNLITENVFWQSKGAVVFRHGGHNTVSRNIFKGGGVIDTGGVRIINNNQTVTDNYFEGLRGQKFLSALTIMNGVPNSPINRYHQVDGARVSGNSFIDITTVGLAVGSDDERSATPINSTVQNNLFTFAEGRGSVQLFDDVSGITFDGNASNLDEPILSQGTLSTPPLVRLENGLLYPEATLGAPRDLAPIAWQDVGVAWYEKSARSIDGGKGRVVENSVSFLRREINAAPPGETLLLKPGVYEIKTPIALSKPLTLKPADTAKPVILTAKGVSAFHLLAGARLSLEAISLTGEQGDHAIIKAVGDHYAGDYSLQLTGVSATAENPDFTGPLIAAAPNTFAKMLSLTGVGIRDWPGAVISLDGEGLGGWYLAEDVKITNSSFTAVQGPILVFGREGRDESTFGPRVDFSKNTVTGSGMPDALVLAGIDGLALNGNFFKRSGALRIKQRVLGLPFGARGNTYEETAAAVITGRDGDTLDAGVLK